VITTVTFNPCIDKCASVEQLIPGKKLRCSAPVFQPGGGGINVARVIKRLKGSVVAVYPAGGYSGKYLNQLLKEEGVNCLPVETISHTRENLVVLEAITGSQYRFGMPGSPLQESEWRECLDAIGRIQSEYIVVSGSLVPGLPPTVMKEIAAIARAMDSRLVVDSSGAALKEALESGVFLVKPNIGELAAHFGRKWISIEEAVELAQQIVYNKQSQLVVVSLGADGAFAVDSSETIQMPCPKVETKSVVGAGDSMLGGIVMALSTGNCLKDALHYGVACGAAATMNAATELCHKQDVEKLSGRVNSDTGHLKC
jgi:6-phosphofructokinase 2